MSQPHLALTIDRAALLPALARTQKIVERRNTIPILSNVLITAEDGRLTLTATDLDLALSATIELANAGRGALTVPAATLHDIVRKLPDSASITLTADGAGLTLQAGRYRSRLPILGAEDFPVFEPLTEAQSFRVPAGDMLQIIQRTSFAISSEETRYYLNGIHLHLAETEAGSRLVGVATDGHRLSRTSIPAPQGSEGMPGIIVPRKTVQEIARLAEGHKGELTVEVSPRLIAVSDGATRLCSKLIDGTFPDYQRVIPAGNQHKAIIDRAALSAAVDRVSAVSGERGKAVKFALDADRLTVSCANPDTGTATEEIEIELDAAAIEIGFNGRYVLDALAIGDSEAVEMALGDPGSPALMRAPDATADDDLIVLMPMRV